MIAVSPSTVSFQGEEFSTIHGSPFDRGTADSYYHRGEQAHWYPNGTGTLPRIEGVDRDIDSCYNTYINNALRN